MSWPALPNLKFGIPADDKWDYYFTVFLGTFFTGCMSNLFFESSVVIFCCTLVHEFALLFYPSRNYTAIMERKIACITINFGWIPTFASKQHSRSRLLKHFHHASKLNWNGGVMWYFAAGIKRVSNITAPWWFEPPRGWKEVFCNNEETKLKLSCVTLKNKISACKVAALRIAREQALHLGESRFTRHNWRAC